MDDSSAKPEKVQIDDRYRTIGRRIYAAMIDGSLFYLAAIAVEILLLDIDPRQRHLWYQAFMVLFAILYPTITTKIWGGTLGKVYFNIHVKSAKDEGRITWFQAFAREAISIVSGVVDLVPFYVFYFVIGNQNYQAFIDWEGTSLIWQALTFLTLGVFIIEIVTAAMSKRRRSVHDFIAGTIVVKVGGYRRWSELTTIISTIILLFVQLRVYNFVLK